MEKQTPELKLASDGIPTKGARSPYFLIRRDGALPPFRKFVQLPDPVADIAAMPVEFLPELLLTTVVWSAFT